MRNYRRAVIGLSLLSVGVLGCRTPIPQPAAQAVYAPPPGPLELPTTPNVVPVKLDFSALPPIDPLSLSAMPAAAEYQSIYESLVQREAARRATVTTLLRSDVEPQSEAGQTLRELRRYLASEASNRAALNALEQYFQLADVEGRRAVLRQSLPLLDDLRKTVKESREKGLRVPVELDELERQRATLIGLMYQAELGGRLLEVDLKRRLGIDGKSTARLQPTGPFPVVETSLDPEALVKIALENRSDLQLLRAAYHGLTPDTLPSIRQLLEDQAGIPDTPATQRILTRQTMKLGPDAQTLADLDVRRQQLMDLILERERAAADEVRAAVKTYVTQTELVRLARWRAESLRQKADDTKDQGQIIPKLAKIEQLRADAELITSVMTWHQARIRLNAAQGLYAHCVE